MVKGVLKPRARGKAAPPAKRLQRNQLAHVDEPSSSDAEEEQHGRLDGRRPRGRRAAAAAGASDGEEEDEEEAVLGVSSDTGSGSGSSQSDSEEDDGSQDSQEEDDSGEEEEEAGGGAAEDGDDGEDEDLDALIARGGKRGRLAQQAKHLGEQLRIARGERESSDDEGGAGARPPSRRDAGAAAWGANKRRYYGDDADDSGSGDDDEDEGGEDADARAEELEARRLQAERAAGLAAEDFGLSGDGDEEDGDGDSDDGDDSGEDEGGKSKKRAPHALVREERVAKAALDDLPDEARRAALEADAPELLALLDELRGALTEVRARAGPLLREVRAGGLATAGGLSYLEAKHLMLTQYCACLVAYLLLRAEGRAVRGHPVVARLVQLRAYLERARPIDRRLAYQVDKLLRATAAARAADGNGANGGGAKGAYGGANGGDASAAAAAAAAAAGGMRPNPAAFVGAGAGEPAPRGQGQQQQQRGGEDEGGEGGEGAAYRPPRLNPASMELDAEEVGPDGLPVRRATSRERHALRDAARRARRSALVQEMAAELAGAPEELRAEAPGLDASAALLAARQRMEARERAEEELFARVPLSKAEAKKLRAQQRAGLAGAGGALDDFADEVADLVGLAASSSGGGAGGGGGGAGGGGILGRLSQRFGADLADQAAADGGAAGGAASGGGGRSGDADLSRRPTLHERRAAFDGAAGRKAARRSQEDEEAPPPLRPGAKRGALAPGAEEDDFYAASRAARDAAKRLKGDAALARRAADRTLPPPLPDDRQADGELRPITDAIQRNRGLTPHRRRDLKNPRVKHRVKHAQAEVRRRGQVQGVREAPGSGGGGYGGEATGIKSRLARGRKLG